MTRHWLTSTLLLTLLLLGRSAPAEAESMVFFAEDTGPKDQPLTPNCTADMEIEFQSHLTSYATEDFECFSLDDSAPLQLTFDVGGQTINATISGNGYIEDSSTKGRYPVSGDKYWDTNQTTSTYSIVFETPIEAFGFYATDVGDYSNAQLKLMFFANDTLIGELGEADLPHSKDPLEGNSGSLIYVGFISDTPFQKVSFEVIPGIHDRIGLDDLTIGFISSSSIVPEPSSLALLTVGAAFGIPWYRRRKNGRLV